MVWYPGTSGESTVYDNMTAGGITSYDSTRYGDIPSSFIQEFSGLVVHAAQQEYSMLRKAVTEETVNGEYKWIEGLNATEMSQRTTRYQDTPLTPQTHTRRRLGTAIYDVADLIEENDSLYSLIDPESEYVRAFGMAAGRQIDATIRDAFSATVIMRDNQPDGSSGQIAWDSTNGNIIDEGEGANIWEKLRLADQQLRANHAFGRRYFALSSVEIYAMFGINVFTSSDFQPGKPVSTGQLPQVLGFTLIPYEDLETSGTHRKCWAWTDRAIRLGISKEPQVKIDVRPDKNHCMQVKLSLGIGAVRVRESDVVEVRTVKDLDTVLGGTA